MKKFSWKSLSFEEIPEATFSSPPVIPDGQPIFTEDPRLAYVLNYQGLGRDGAVQVPAVARGIHSLTALAALPLQTLSKTNEKKANRLIDQIDPEVPNLITITRTIEDLVFDGVAIWEVTESTKGYPTSARHVPRNRYSMDQKNLTNGDIEYTYHLYGTKVVDNSRIIRFDSPRPALLGVMSQAVRQSIAIAVTSEMFAKNPMPKMVFTPKADADPDPEQVEEQLIKFRDNRAENPFAYLGSAIEGQAIQYLSPVELQLIESDKSMSLAIANFFDMDPDQVGLATNNGTYNNAVDRRIDRRNNQLQWLGATIEQRLSMSDITPRGYTVKFNYDEFLRVDPKSKAEIAQIEMAMGALTVDEYRLDTNRAPLTPAEKQELKPVETTTNVEASRKPTATFDADLEMNLEFEGTSFARDSINSTSRTVQALAVPYGQAARSGGRKYEFEKGALYWSALDRVKLLRDHDNTHSVGKAVDAQETDKGLVITFKVAPGPAGDKSLADFMAGTHDGVSIGVDFEAEDVVIHPDKPGVRLVKKAKLREVSQCAIPAFDDSRSIAVEMSRGTDTTLEDGEPNMSEETNTPDVAKLVADAVTAAFAAREVKTEEAPIQDTAPVLESKTKEKETTVVTFVNEEPLYRFDGSQGKYEFSTDLYQMNKGDHEAEKRVNEYLSAEFAVTVSNTAALNPTIQTGRYVDQKEYRYPIFNAIKKGNVPNGVQPFAWNKYNSSSTLVADHTEGVEPTLGSASFTSQTVTPTMVSGKIEINRETWETGGNPAASQLIRNLMVRAYNEALEVATVTFLDAASLTDVTLTTAAADDVLVDNLVGNLIDLRLTRGGFTMDDLFLQADLYKKLALAKDADKRYLLPAVGPANAVGSTQNRFAGLDINGLVGVTSWALAASGQTTAANSYLLDRNDVAAWASTPNIQNFDVQVKSVYVGLWGYKAFAIQDATGIRRIKWDPTT